jgi:hypothetical protein
MSKLTKAAKNTANLAKASAKAAHEAARQIEMKAVQYKAGDRTIPFNVDITAATVWASQQQIADLYGRDKSVIAKYIKDVFAERELDEKSVVAKFAITAADGKTYDVMHYSLDVILAVGFRTKSPEAAAFRRWANETLRRYLQDGYAINERRLRVDPAATNRLAERLRAIRAEEKHLFASVRDFFKEASSDYDPTSRECKSFYAVLQDKFHYAVSAKTASEIILDRANHKEANMGLQTFEGNLPSVVEAKVGKNYLDQNELFALHILAEQFLLYVQSKAIRGKSMMMKELGRKLDELIAVNDYEVFAGYKPGADRERADQHATEQYARFLVRLRKDDVQPIG